MVGEINSDSDSGMLRVTNRVKDVKVKNGLGADARQVFGVFMMLFDGDDIPIKFSGEVVAEDVEGRHSHLEECSSIKGQGDTATMIINDKADRPT